MSTTAEPPIRKTPWLTRDDFARLKEQAHRPRTPEESRESLIRAGIIDDAGNLIDHPYYEKAYGPRRENRQPIQGNGHLVDSAP